MKVYYNLKRKRFYTDEPYYGERVYISGKEFPNDIVTAIAFGEKGKGSDVPAPKPKKASSFYNIKGFYEQ